VLGLKQNEGSRCLVTRHTLEDQKHSKSLRILLAEDNLINSRMATHILEKQGHDVQIAVNGKEAVAFIENSDFDLVLMDVQMPLMDGLLATRTIRKMENPNSSRIPIIAMTAHALSGDRERCLAAGMNDYISKPINPNELLGLIDKWTRSRTNRKND
jgi:two-component system sensor histidine kinase/response regulator